MSKKANELITDSLQHLWNAAAAPSAGATCTASVSPGTGSEKLHLTQLGWSIRNAGAAAYTATLNVRDSSIAGSVLASWDVVIAAAASAQDSWFVNIMGAKGNPLNVDFGVPATSVTQKVSIAGWRNQSTN